MKKLLTIILCALLSLLTLACGATKTPKIPAPSEANAGTQLPSPMVFVETAAAFSELGITIDAPEGASEVSYSIIGDKIAQIQFQFGGFDYTYRASSKESDIAGIHDARTNAFVFDVVYDGFDATFEVVIQSAASGGKLAHWEQGGIHYTLWCAGMPDDDAFKACALRAMAKTFEKVQEIAQAVTYADFTGQETFDMDLNGDNKLEHVSFQPILTSDDYIERITLTIFSDDGSIDAVHLRLASDPCVVFAEDIDADGLVELFISGDICSCDYETWVFRYDGGKLIAAKSEAAPIGEEDGTVPPAAYGAISNIEGNVITIGDVVDILGSWWCVTQMQMQAQGFVLERIPGSVWTYPVNIKEAFGEYGVYLETIKELPVTLGGESATTTLPIGTKLVPFETNGRTYLRFITESGVMGVINVTFNQENWEYFIDGVNANELFTSLPYAG